MPPARSWSHHHISSHPRLQRPILHYCNKRMSSGIDLINPAQCQLHTPRITTITLVTPGHQRPILHYCSKRSICGMDLINSCQCRLHALRFTSSIWTPQATSVPSFTTSANASHVEQVLSNSSQCRMHAPRVTNLLESPRVTTSHALLLQQKHVLWNRSSQLHSKAPTCSQSHHHSSGHPKTPRPILH